MKNLSKVLAVVLAFAMALSMVSFAAYTDVAEDANYSEAVAVLSDLKILTGYEDGSFKPEATITRAEFATVVIRMLGLADSASGGAEIFTDVAADHWANGYIALAAQQGIVNGYGDGRFGPEDPVKYQEAIKMVVAALGYTPMADANGGYPGGYKVVASQKGILAGISGAKDNEAASRAIVAQLAYNSLDVPLMEQTGFGTQTNFQTVSTLLMNKLGVTKFEGSVNGTLASGAVSKAGKVELTLNKQIVGVAGKALAERVQLYTVVGSTQTAGIVDTFKAAPAVEEAAKALLDTASIIYIKDIDSDDAEIVSILKDGNRDAKVSFMTEDLKANAALNEDANGVATLEVYTDKAAGEYEEYDIAIDKIYINGRTQAIETFTETLADGADTPDTSATPVTITAGDQLSTTTSPAHTLTGDEVSAVINKYLKAANAVDVTLLSNKTEDVYNVMYLTVWADYVVNRISERNYKLYAKGGNTITLDETSKTSNFTIYKDGEIASFADIAENDVVSIAGNLVAGSSGEVKYGDVYITSEQIEGTVTGKATTGNDIKVDGTTYKTTGLSVKLGDKAVFYVNARGVLVGLDKTATAADLKYGYASYIYEDPNFGDSQIRMLSADGVWATYDVATKFTSFAAGSMSDATDDTYKFNIADTAFAWTGVQGVTANYDNKPAMYSVKAVVAYDLDENGKIDEIYFAPSAMTDSPYDNTGRDWSNNAGTFDPTDTKIYTEATGFIGGNEVDDTTVIFNIASTIAGDNASPVYPLAIDEDDVTVVTLSSLIDRDPYKVLNAFNIDDDTNVAAVLVGQDIVSGIDWAADFFVVSDAPYVTTNEAGEAGVMLTGLVAGEEATLFLNTDDLEAGDVVDATYSGGANATGESNITINTLATGAINKGDVILYNLNAKGEAGKVVVLVDASDVATGSATAFGKLAPIGTEAATILATESVGTTNYEFVFGYAKELNDTRLTLISAANTANTKNVKFSADTIGAIYDAYTGANNGKVMEALYGDVTTDPTYGDPGNANDGDFVFARIINGVTVDAFVIIANDR